MKKLISVILAALIALCVMPVTALAENDEGAAYWFDETITVFASVYDENTQQTYYYNDSEEPYQVHVTEHSLNNDMAPVMNYEVCDTAKSLAKSIEDWAKDLGVDKKTQSMECSLSFPPMPVFGRSTDANPDARYETITDAKYGEKITRYAASEITFSGKILKQPDIELSELIATVSGIEAGATVGSTSVSTTGTGYSVDICAWHDCTSPFDKTGENEMQSTAVLEGGKTYVVGVRFTAAQGYAIATSPNATINGEDGKIGGYDGSARLYFVAVTVPAPPKVTITFDANGGTPGTQWNDTVEVTPGYTGVFNGDNEDWVKPPAWTVFDAFEVNGERVEANQSITVTENTTIKFLWKAVDKNGWVEEDGKLYYYVENELQKSKLVKDKGIWYYTDADGSMYMGWKAFGSNWRYFGSDGIMAIGLKKLDNGNWYYFNNSGIRQSGKIAFGNNWRFFKEDGVMATGLTKVEGKWYFLNSSGLKQCNYWQEIGNYKRFFGADGVMVTGLKKIDGAWYYFDTSNGLMKTGWVKFGTNFRYFKPDGTMATGLTKATNGNWYYFNGSGIRQYGWQKFGSNWRYFDKSSGVMLASCTKKIDGKNYTFNASGICTNK